MYKMEVNNVDKIFFIQVEGILTLDQAKNYIEDLKKHLVRIPNPRDYHLVIDAKEQKPVAQDAQGILAEVMALYVATPFKSHHTVIFHSPLMNAQIMRLGEKMLAHVFQFHNTAEEALRSCEMTTPMHK